MKTIYRIFTTLLLLILIGGNTIARSPYPAGLKIISDNAEYQKQIKADANQELVDLEKSIPGLVIDIRYATSDNFTKQAVYPAARAFARKPVAQQLKAIQEELKLRGLGLKIYDAYRPYAVTVKFFEVYPDSVFVANPKKGSRHNRGAAIDASLIDLKTGKELQMPSAFDEFSERAKPSFQGISELQKVNRKLLIELMTKHGFTVYDSEWWHFDFNGWENFPLMDLTFEELEH